MLTRRTQFPTLRLGLSRLARFQRMLLFPRSHCHNDNRIHPPSTFHNPFPPQKLTQFSTFILTIDPNENHHRPLHPNRLLRHQPPHLRRRLRLRPAPHSNRRQQQRRPKRRSRLLQLLPRIPFRQPERDLPRLL